MSLNSIIQKSIQNSRARNILDNSDFTNPINQRGKTTYASTSGGYTIDRWIANASLTLKVNTSTITASSSGNTQNEFYQKIENPDRLLGKAITFAIKTDIGIFVTNGTVPNNFTKSGAIIGTPVDTDFGQIHVEIKDNSKHAILVAISVKSGASVTIHWAALYEGKYNAETLPDYWPKGYAVELAECQRYYRYYDQVTVSIFGDVYIWLSLNFPPMRAVPSFSSGTLYGGDSKAISGASIDYARVSKTGVTTLRVAGNKKNVPVYAVSKVALNADL